MNIITATKLRRLIPASAVAAMLALAYMAPIPVDASKVNNCGVKGGYAYGGYAFAFHDHGKPCPNRPFPGQGKGLAKFGISSTAPTTNDITVTVTNDTTISVADTTISVATKKSEDTGDASGKSHEHGNGHGHGSNHGRGKG